MKQLNEHERIKEVNSVFEQPWWLEIVAPQKWQEFVVEDKNGQCIGRLPYADMSLYGMKYCGTPIMTQQLGPWFKFDKGMKTVARLKRVKQVSEEFIVLLGNNTNVDLFFHNSYQYVLPFIWAGYNVEPKFSYVLDDLSDTDFIYQGFDAKVRNLIKKAEQDVSVSENVSEGDLVRLLTATYVKQGRKLPFSETVLRQVYSTARDNKAGRALGAVDKKSGKMVAVVFFLYDKSTCYYLLGGKDYSNKVQGTQELLLWEGIKFASTVSKEFDFEGSMISGIESFFRGFGGRPRVYYRVWRGSFLFNMLYWLKPRVKKLLGYK